jgi:SAM-dependent methyltransferase
VSERDRWNRLASANPYWTVLVDPRYRSEAASLGADAMRDFFETGKRDVGRILGQVRRSVGEDFRPRRVLDYGCGVGRLTIPLARNSENVVGVDLSSAMLSEARENCARQDVGNAEFLDATDFLAMPDSRFAFDFACSYIVLQHIPPRVGLDITRAILRRLIPGGIAALHYTLARNASPLRRIVHGLRRDFPPVNVAVNALRRKPLLEPLIPVFEYDLEALYAAFAATDCVVLNTDLTKHGEFLGAMFILLKRQGLPGGAFGRPF